MASGIVISDRRESDGKVKVGAWEAKDGMITAVHLGYFNADITQLGGLEKNPAALALMMLNQLTPKAVGSRTSNLRKPKKATAKRKEAKVTRR
jgi:hypothetical protein